MKKGLLLSVVASGFIFAGGNIAPVQPVVPAAAPAACDFWGTIALRYDAMKLGTPKIVNGVNVHANKWKGDSKSVLALDLGVEKELGYGFGIGAEMGAFYTGNYKFKKTGETAELSQLYVTYKAGNTAIKAGRQALPKSLSPWAWSDKTAGVIDTSFNGIVVVNTDIADTTLVGAWIASTTDGAKTTKINGSNKGLFMLAGQYTGIANTTLSSSIYFIPKNGAKGKAFSVWAAGTTKVNNFDLGLQVAYAKANAGSIAQKGAGTKATIGVAAYAGTKYDAFDAKLTLAYINKGNATLNLGGTSGFWGNTFGGVFGGDTTGATQKIARLDLGYSLADGSKIYGGVAADKATGSKTQIAARVGYDFKIKDVAAKIEYRFHKDQNSNKNHRIRIQGVYKF